MKVCRILCTSELAHLISFIDEGVAKWPNVYGDIILTPEQEKFLIPDHELSLVQGFFNRANKWPMAEVPYELDPAFDRIWSELENLLNVP